MKNILIVTSIRPDRTNRGGPSGLIWEIIEVLKLHHQISIVLKMEHNKVVSKLNQFGLYMDKLQYDFSNIDEIFVYPNYIVGYIPKCVHSKIVVLGPDSTGLVFRRFYRAADNFKKWKYLCYYKWFVNFENNLLQTVRKIAVVGEVDKKWLNINKNPKECGGKVVFLRHPILSNVMCDFSKTNYFDGGQRRLVFAGDLSYHYVGTFMHQVVNSIIEEKSMSRHHKVEVIVVGEYNKWIYDLLISVQCFNVTYQVWIDDYRDICRPGLDVHCVPLMAGAGTKNRVLTAIANGVEIISTPIGIENIIRESGDDLFIHVYKNAKSFANMMLLLVAQNIDSLSYKKIIDSRKKYRDKVKKEFESDLNHLIE